MDQHTFDAVVVSTYHAEATYAFRTSRHMRDLANDALAALAEGATDVVIDHLERIVMHADNIADSHSRAVTTVRTLPAVTS